MSTYVVTGGLGFIGSHLVRSLIRLGHSLRILDNVSGNGAGERALEFASVPKITIVDADIRDLQACQSICANADYVMHLAAEPSVVRSIEDPLTTVSVNVLGTVNLLQSAVDAKTVRRFVNTSTCAVYGDAQSSPISETIEPQPSMPYATSKLAGELFGKNFFQLYGLEVVSLRYFNVYGADQDPNGAYAAVIPKFISRIAAGQPLIVYGDGEQSRDFVHIDDVVQANLLAATSQNVPKCQVFNIGSGQQISLNQLIRKLENAVGAKIEVEHHPARSGEIRYSLADISLARAILKFEPSVDIDTGLARMVATAR